MEFFLLLILHKPYRGLCNMQALFYLHHLFFLLLLLLLLLHTLHVQDLLLLCIDDDDEKCLALQLLWKKKIASDLITKQFHRLCLLSATLLRYIAFQIFRQCVCSCFIDKMPVPRRLWAFRAFAQRHDIEWKRQKESEMQISTLVDECVWIAVYTNMLGAHTAFNNNN